MPRDTNWPAELSLPAHFDPVSVWAGLSPAEQARLGQAALILAYAWLAADWVDGPRAAGFEAAEMAAEAAIAAGLPAIALRQNAEGAVDLPLPDLSAIGTRACRGCGCTEQYGCAEGCSWVPTDGRGDLCSACDPRRGGSR